LFQRGLLQQEGTRSWYFFTNQIRFLPNKQTGRLLGRNVLHQR
jgi:hypothetical protein